MRHTNHRRSIGICVTALALSSVVACENDDRVKGSQAEIEDEQRRTRVSTVRQPITITNWILREDFNTLQVTRDLPTSPYTSHHWYSQEDTSFNGEVQHYRTYIYNDALSTAGATGIVCDDSITDKNNCQSGHWTLRIVDDSSAGADDDVDDDVNGSNGDTRALQLRAIRNTTNGEVYSARLNGKRFTQFVPTATKGIRVEIRMRYEANTINQGSWPAFWLLGARIAEDPIIGDGDNVSWPCDGSTEVDIMEVGSVWGRQYNKSSMHYGFDPCQHQVVRGTLSADKTLGGSTYYDDGSYQTFAFEWEIDRARFYHNGTQYGPELDSSNGMFDTEMFPILNYAVGGGLGGAVTASAFDSGRSIFVDWIRIGEFDVSGTPTARSFTSGTVRLEAEDYDGMLGVQYETCSEGGQNAGWTDPATAQNDFIEWYIDVPATADYKVRTRSSVNKPGGATTYAVLTRKESQNYEKRLEMAIGDTGGWQSWQDFDTAPFELTEGRHWIRIEFTGASQNLNWMEVFQHSAGSSCTDGIQNGSETGLDCGGTCSACPTCSDGVLNQGETSMDCGGPNCPACNSGSDGATIGSKIQAEDYTHQGGTQLTNSSTTVGYFGQNDFIRFEGVDFSDAAGLSMRVASGASGTGTINVIKGCDTSGSGGTVLGTHNQTNTGGWGVFVEQNMAFTTFATGEDSLCLKVTSSSDAWDVDWVQLVTGDNANGGGGDQTGGNLLANGGFEDGTSGWQSYFLNGGSLTTETVASSGSNGGKLTIDGTDGSTKWHSHIFQTIVTQGTSYTITAKGRNANSGNKNFTLFCEENGNGYTSYGTQTCTASDSGWTSCSLTCSSMPVGMSAKFGIFAGESDSDLRVDEATVTKN